jgi:hypothetical protein
MTDCSQCVGNIGHCYRGIFVFFLDRSVSYVDFKLLLSIAYSEAWLALWVPPAGSKSTYAAASLKA